MTTKTTNTTIFSTILWGLFYVNGPVSLLLFGLPLLTVISVILWRLPITIIFISIPISFVLAWLWWSWALPKWRLWALNRIDDIPQLYKRAIQVGLMWPRGHFFEKTEIKSTKHSIEEREFELSYSLSILQNDFDTVPNEVKTNANILLNCIEQQCSCIQRAETAFNLKETLISITPLLSNEDLFIMQRIYDLISLLTEYEKLLNKVNSI